MIPQSVINTAKYQKILKNQWKSVEEYTPPFKQKYEPDFYFLALTSEKNIFIVSASSDWNEWDNEESEKYDFDQFPLKYYTNVGLYSIKYVTHWMELPEIEGI